MNVDLLIKENKELKEEKQRYKEMWFTANNSLAKYRNIEKELGYPLEILKPNQKVEFIKDNETLCADVMGINIQSKKIMIGSAWSFKELPLNQYKKTWWLKKDKSEQDGQTKTE